MTDETFKPAIADESAPCPVCGAGEYTIIAEAGDYECRLPGKFYISRCNGCGLLFQNPRPAFSEIRRYYTEEYEPYREAGSPWMRALRRRFLAEPRIRKFKTLFADVNRPIDLLDVGCARGDMLYEISRDNRFNCRGVEPVEYAAETARSRGLDVHATTLEDFQCEDDSFDIITMIHVLEHLPNPGEVIERVFKLLREGGLFFGETPCATSLERAVFGKYWSLYHLPRHLTFFSRTNIVQFLEKFGFRDIEIRLQPTPGSWPGSARNCMLAKKYPKSIYNLFTIHSAPVNIMIFPFVFTAARLGFASIMHFTARK